MLAPCAYVSLCDLTVCESAIRLILKAKPEASPPEPPYNAISTRVRVLLESRYADYLDLFFVLSNFIFLMCNNQNASLAFLYSFYMWSATYLGVIVLKSVLTLVGYGFRICRSDTFFLIDLLVIIWAVGATYMTSSLKFAVSFLRICRVPSQLERLNLWIKSEMYLALIETFRLSALDFVKVFYLLGLVVYITAAFCVQIFRDTRFGTRLSHTANFQDVPAGFMTLTQIIFGDEWHSIMDDCSVQQPLCSETQLFNLPANTTNSRYYTIRNVILHTTHLLHYAQCHTSYYTLFSLPATNTANSHAHSQSKPEASLSAVSLLSRSFFFLRHSERGQTRAVCVCVCVFVCVCVCVCVCSSLVFLDSLLRYFDTSTPQ